MSDTLKVCGLTIERGTKLRTYLPVPDTNVKIPMTIINGDQDGPTLLITAGIHGRRISRYRRRQWSWAAILSLST